tara:strand:- start:513 stop:833 length:321 start_codon:yes stop_codon:yes gene_type:complete
MIEGALAAFQFNRVATPVVAGMSDVSFMIVLGTFLTYFFPKIVIPTTATGMEEVAEAIERGIRETLEDDLERRQEFADLQNEYVAEGATSIFNVIRGLLLNPARRL